MSGDIDERKITWVDCVDRIKMAVVQVERRLWKTWRQAVEDGGDMC